MKYDLEETVTAALMCGIPVVIVEGQDDIKFYDNIAALEGLTVEVQAVETIEGYSEGCEQVCKALDDALCLFQNDGRLKKYVIGIIDRDARQFMNTLPLNDNLLVLKYYSYETHLITDATITKLLEQLTKVPGSLITHEVIDWIKQDFEERMIKLYYFSLEALKGRLDDTYHPDIPYSLSGDALIGKARVYRWGVIEEKIQDLNNFANEIGVSIRDLKYIANGKWILAAWCDYLVKKAKTLHKKCGVQLPQCEYCKAGKTNKCLWRPSATFQSTEIKSQLYTQSFIDMEEVGYIAKYMEQKLAC